GTSMGSIIGGLYALGYSADQLDSIIRSVNWDLVLSNSIPFNYIAYEEKGYYARYLAEFELANGKLQLPSGLIEGQVLGDNLTRFTWPSNKYTDFDEFPIPFRCVATDVSTGKPIVFKEGSLAKAIRASMAIPTAFTAVDLDTTLAVDGGVVDNFPVEEVINMGADIVIGVSVGDGLKSAYDLEGMSQILFQVSMLPSLTRMETLIEQCGIYIRPDLKDNSTASFGKYAEILDLGYAAGDAHRSDFRKLADSLGLTAKPVQGLKITDVRYKVGEIVVKGQDQSHSKLILSKLGIKVGDLISYNNLEKGIESVFGTTHFAKVASELEPVEGTDMYRLTLIVREKESTLMKAAFHYDNVFSAGIVLNLTFRELLGKSSRTILLGDISKNPKMRVDYLKYIGKKQNLALHATYDYSSEQIPNYNKGKLEDIEVSYENQLALGFITTQSLGHSFYVGGLYRLLNQKFKFNNITPEGLKNGQFNVASLDLNYQSNTLNDRNYPTFGKEIAVLGRFSFYNDYQVKYDKGVDVIYIPLDLFGTIIEWPLTEEDFNNLIIDPFTPDRYGTLSVRYRQFINVSPYFQLIPLISSGITISESPEGSLFYNYRIGGFQRVKYDDVPFVGLNTYEADYDNFFIGGLFLQNVILKNFFLKYGANLLLPHDHVPVNDLKSLGTKQFTDEAMLGYGAELTYKSFLGPVNLGLGNNTVDGRFRFYLSIGFSLNYSD
ncbi:MAG: patatin-like phospholipase family protein, partial [Bacteroidales bacterium]|nr:patatin-like phospholipase family protein [Bacteroidales bacterium]